jgi:hypothetical protein
MATFSQLRLYDVSEVTIKPITATKGLYDEGSWLELELTDHTGHHSHIEINSPRVRLSEALFQMELDRRGLDKAEVARRAAELLTPHGKAE